MSNDETSPTPYFSLKLQHEKYVETLRSQVEDSKQCDDNATGILRASFAFSSVASAVVYYLSRDGSANQFGAIDNPLTYAGLFFGLTSLVSSVAVITHTKIQSELHPDDIDSKRNSARFRYCTLLWRRTRGTSVGIDGGYRPIRRCWRSRSTRSS